MNSILVTTNGPYEFEGEFELMSADGRYLAHETQTSLCRCGRSADKPYCDGTHEKTGFVDNSSPPAADAAQSESTGPVRVTLRANGPLKLAGPFELRHPTLGVLLRADETALCRCGHSKKKPFCDGTHRTIEFVA
jgi:CDGSH-type Zn-finger protein